MDSDRFMECDNCRVKPGSPILCDSCYHNRRLIDDLQRRLSEIEKLTTQAIELIKK